MIYILYYKYILYLNYYIIPRTGHRTAISAKFTLYSDQMYFSVQYLIIFQYLNQRYRGYLFICQIKMHSYLIRIYLFIKIKLNDVFYILDINIPLNVY